MKNLSQPYYIDKRRNSLSLNGEWAFFFNDTEKESFLDEDFLHLATIPNSIYRCLNEAGILPDPYIGENSKLYSWVDEKIYYFKKSFFLSEQQGKLAFLCFEGLGYFSRLWINSNLIGSHEGMFGGPVVEASSYLKEGKNEIIVEIKAPNFGHKKDYDFFNFTGKKKEIVPWNIARDNCTSNGDFIVFGIWNEARIEFLDRVHISRPFLYTKSISNNKATLQLSLEIANGQVEELQNFFGHTQNGNYLFEYTFGITPHFLPENVHIEITVREQENNTIVYHSRDEQPLLDHKSIFAPDTPHESQFFEKEIFIENPQLWYPLGLGEQPLYDVEIKLHYNDKICDEISFETAIRTIETKRTPTPKYRFRWENYLFSVNGKEFFLKGMNWQPVDFLYSIDPAEYEWMIQLVKNAGIQLLRVWNGGGMYETETFYKLCNKYGILVWQDTVLRNEQASEYPLLLIENEIAYNLFRIRNHPALAVYCGGNEFVPYTDGHAACMFVVERTVNAVDPTRKFYMTTPLSGSAHVYKDMDPVWFGKMYADLPFLAESGIHCFPSIQTLKKVISQQEIDTIWTQDSSKNFASMYPELLNHFSEYTPDRIVRLTARASQITKLDNVSLADVCEATHVQSFEFYQHMIWAMRANYPKTAGVMPWVLSRPWPTCAIQLVDGFKQPLYPYYAIQNAYRNVAIRIKQDWTIVKIGETVSLKAEILADNEVSGYLQFTVYGKDMETIKTERLTIQKEVKEYDFGVLSCDKKTCYLFTAELLQDEKVTAKSVAFTKTAEAFDDEELYKKHRTAPNANLVFNNGPWLKEEFSQCNGKIEASIRKTYKEKCYTCFEISLRNPSNKALFPVTFNVNGFKRFMASDEFFLLKPMEEKIVKLTCDTQETTPTITVKGWNFKSLTLLTKQNPYK